MNRFNGQVHPTRAQTARLDLCAAGLSTLCLLHCLALPLLVAVMPLVAQAADNELVHRVLVILALPVSLRVIWKTLPLEGNGLLRQRGEAPSTMSPSESLDADCRRPK